MTNAERVIEYIDLKPEEPPLAAPSLVLPPRWPTGDIVFDDLSFRYSTSNPWVLKNIHLHIAPKEKVRP
jgi:ABC-type multidrug transport system fused ATPase/permease subunit